MSAYAIEYNKNHTDCFLNLGNIQKLLGQFDEALNTYYQGLEINPKDSDILFNIGNLYLDSNKYSKAIDYYNEVLLTDHKYKGAIINKSIAENKLHNELI